MIVSKMKKPKIMFGSQIYKDFFEKQGLCDFFPNSVTFIILC